MENSTIFFDINANFDKLKLLKLIINIDFTYIQSSCKIMLVIKNGKKTEKSDEDGH